MPVDLFFSVPLCVHDVEPAVRDAIQKKVSLYLESESAKRIIALSPEESMLTSYYRPESSILADADLVELESAVLGAAQMFLERTLKLPPRALEIERAWINVFPPGAQEAQHTHDGSLLSCSYYVEAPANCGCIVFPDPIGERRSYRQFTRTAGSDLLTRSEIAVEPQPGRLVMFESWLPHAVQCNKSDKVRISIAMNLRQVSAPAKLAAARSDAPAPAHDAERRVGGAGTGTTPAAAAGSTFDTAATAAATPSARTAPAHARPFLFNELFDVPANLAIALHAVADEIPTVVVDGFLKHADRAREIVGSTPAPNWKHEKGGRNFVDYYDCRLRFPIRFPNSMIAAAQQIIRKAYAADTRPAEASVDVNWFMQISDKRGDFAVPHSDVTEKVRRSFTCIVYLNSADECSGGTAFFRFKESRSLIIDNAYARAIQERTRIAETGLDYWPEDAEAVWERVGAVDMVPGRLLIFPSEYFHSAYHPQNSFYGFPRLTLAFWMVC